MTLTPILAEGSGGFPSWLTPELQVLVWSVAVFLALLGLLWKFAWGPLMQALEEREHRIAKKIDDAEARFKEAEAKAAEYEKRLEAAKAEATAIIDEGKRDAVKVQEQIQAAANAEAAKTLERAKREIKLAQDQAIAELRDRLVDFTAEMAATVIEREVKAEDHRRFIEQGIEKVGQKVQ
ncbi:MAG: F0F1 ATP synthase subunit B [Planctomycetota bacterium]|nr:F0F1 ATP synthase subunit B [Planctomycetota bacterium]